jgi:hypothetical protein
VARTAQSADKPKYRVACLEVAASIIPRQSAPECGKFSPTQHRLSPSQEISLVLISVRLTQ